MDIRKIKKLENMEHEFQFVNEWGRTRNGFYHKSTLFMLYDNGGSCDVNTAKVNYLNRTWESYNFQTSMQRCVLDFIENRFYYFIKDYKDENGISRLPKNKRTELKQEFEKLDTTKELRAILLQLEKSC